MPCRIYLASSWRNEVQPKLVDILRKEGHEVYDFRNPSHGVPGFSWKAVGLDPQNCTVEQYKRALHHTESKIGFAGDLHGMVWADTCVLLLPSGRSAHLEAGWMAGRGKRTVVLTRDNEEPELMALLLDKIVGDISELLSHLATLPITLLPNQPVRTLEAHELPKVRIPGDSGHPVKYSGPASKAPKNDYDL